MLDGLQSEVMTSAENSTDFLNSTTPKPHLVSYLDKQDWSTTLEVYSYHIVPILQFIGFPINLFHLFVLFHKEMRSNVVYRLMIAICLCDLISHVFTVTLYTSYLITNHRTGETRCYLSFTYLEVVLELYSGLVLDITQRNSTWLALFMALFRTLSVKFPLSSAVQYFGKSQIVIGIVLVIAIASGLITSNMFSFFTIQSYDVDTNCDGFLIDLNETRFAKVVPNDAKTGYLAFYGVYGFIKALPPFFDIILAVFLLLELRKVKKRRRNMNMSEDDKSNTTALILFMTVSFFILEVPNGLSQMTSALFSKNVQLHTIMFMIATLAELLPAINSSSHVFVCYFMSSQYREIAQKMLGISKRKVTVIEVGKTSTGSNS